jgi:predicted enzyme related to lactoylglutathione lyase
LTTPDKWISIDFTATGGGGRGGGAPPAPGAAPAPAPAPAQAAAAGPVSNKGTVLDRFALEVKGIDAFVKKIEADGVKVTKQVSTNADGLKTAMIVDVLGNDVELIEGLSGK